MSIENIIQTVVVEGKEAEVMFPASTWLKRGLFRAVSESSIDCTLEMNGVHYGYTVPTPIFAEFVRRALTESAGKAYHALLRGKYRGERLE